MINKRQLICFSTSLLVCFSMVGAMKDASAAEDILHFSVQNSEPKYIVNEDTVTGLCGDIYSALIEQLAESNIKIVVSGESAPIKRILKNLKSGSSDVFCGAQRNELREQDYYYSIRPVYDISNVVVMHKDDIFEPKSFDDIRKAKIEVSSYYGTASADFLKLQSGILVDDSYNELMPALRAVATKKHVRMFFYHDLSLLYLVKKSKLPLRVVPTKFKTTQHWMMYSRTTDPDLIEQIDTGLLNLEVSGRLAAIRSKYIHVD